jgi:FkbM family methyltransferase
MEFNVTEEKIKRELADAKSNAKYLPMFGQGGVFLDLGANIGEVSINASLKFDKVIGVEAHPHTFQRAKKRVEEANATNVILLNRAVASSTGEKMFVSTPENTTGATARREKRLTNPAEGYYKEITSIGINDLLSEYKPRVVKIDIEGAEYEVLNSAEFPDSVEWLTVEFHGVRSESGAKRLQDCLNKLSAIGFEKLIPKEISCTNGIPKALYFVAVFRRNCDNKN